MNNTWASATYEGITVDLYDLWFSGEPLDDHAFYAQHIKKNGGLALEVGSGTGRLLLPYLQEGLQVQGIEPSTSMTEICLDKARKKGFEPVVYEQVVERLRISESYRTIFIPLCTFQLVVRYADVFEALRRIYLHLEEGGQVLIPLFIPRCEAYAHDGKWSIKRTTGDIYNNSQVVLSEAAQYNRFEQIETKWLKYEICKKDFTVDTHVRMIQLRWYSRYEFRYLLQAMGFKEVTTFGDYRDEQASELNDIIIFSAYK